MWMPGLSALIVTRRVEGKPIRSLNLRRLGPRRAYLWAWLVPPFLAVLTGLLTWIFGLGVFDTNFTLIRESMQAAPGGAAVPPALVVAIQAVFAFTLGALFNTLFGLGEELGWRGYLLPGLLGLGQWRAILVSGVIWGVWHAPIILQGHNYPEHPVPGVFMMVVFLRINGHDLQLAVPVDAQSLGACPGTRLVERHCRPAAALPDRRGHDVWRHTHQPGGMAAAGSFCRLAGLEPPAAGGRPRLFHVKQRIRELKDQ